MLWHIMNFISERAFTQVNQENCGKYAHKLNLDGDLYSLWLKTTKCDNDMELGGASSYVEWKAGVSVAGVISPIVGHFLFLPFASNSKKGSV